VITNDKPKVFCKKCGVRLVDGARAKYCGFTVCLDIASESKFAKDLK
jgi:hypothetical protein